MMLYGLLINTKLKYFILITFLVISQIHLVVQRLFPDVDSVYTSYTQKIDYSRNINYLISDFSPK